MGSGTDSFGGEGEARPTLNSFKKFLFGPSNEKSIFSQIALHDLLHLLNVVFAFVSKTSSNWCEDFCVSACGIIIWDSSPNCSNEP